jgi:hypothetical protein
MKQCVSFMTVLHSSMLISPNVIGIDPPFRGVYRMSSFLKFVSLLIPAQVNPYATRLWATSVCPRGNAYLLTLHMQATTYVP